MTWWTTSRTTSPAAIAVSWTTSAHSSNTARRTRSKGSTSTAGSTFGCGSRSSPPPSPSSWRLDSRAFAVRAAVCTTCAGRRRNKQSFYSKTCHSRPPRGRPMFDRLVGNIGQFEKRPLNLALTRSPLHLAQHQRLRRVVEISSGTFSTSSR